EADRAAPEVAGLGQRDGAAAGLHIGRANDVQCTGLRDGPAAAAGDEIAADAALAEVEDAGRTRRQGAGVQRPQRERAGTAHLGGAAGQVDDAVERVAGIAQVDGGAARVDVERAVDDKGRGLADRAAGRQRQRADVARAKRYSAAAAQLRGTTGHAHG